MHFSTFSTERDEGGIRDYLGIINNIIHLDQGSIMLTFRENSQNFAMFSWERDKRENPEIWLFD